MTDRSRPDPNATAGHDHPTKEKPAESDHEGLSGGNAEGTEARPSSDIASEEQERQLESGEENPG